MRRVLERFDGIAWRADPQIVGTTSDGRVEIPETDLPPAVRDAPESDRYEVRFTNTGLADPLILTAGQTLSVSGVSRRSGVLRVSDQGVIEAEKPPPLRSQLPRRVGAPRPDPRGAQRAPAPTTRTT